jgi:cytochrome P450
MAGCPYVRADFDYWDEDSLREPFPLYKEFRDAECPVARTEVNGGYYLVSRYEEVARVVQDNKTFISGGGISVPEFPSEYSMFPVETDRPLHQEYRRLLNDPLRPKEVAKLESTTRRLVNDLIDEFIESGECELNRDLASPLVTMIIAPFMGLDEKYWDQLKGSAFEMLYGEDKETASAEYFDFIRAQLDERRENPRDDFLTRVIEAEIKDGDETRPLNEHETLSVLWSLLLAATDTTTGLVVTSLWFLAKDPELKGRFVADRSLIERNLEEFVRLWVGPTLARTVAAPVTVGGVDMEPGDKVVFMLQSAGRDERVFENPDEFMFDRPNAGKHLGFGIGIHKCVGMHLARMQFKVMMEEIFRRFPDYEVTTDEPVITGGATWQVRTLPLRFAPGDREGQAVPA